MHTKITGQSVLNFVTLDEAKRQLNIINNNDDDLDIYAKLQTAMSLAQKATLRALSPCTVTLVISNTKELYLPYGEVLAVTSVRVDNNDISHEFNPITQRLKITDSVLPTDEITVVYNAGYTTPEEVPHAIKMGTKMLLSSLYYNREDTVTGVTVNDIPLDSKRLFEAEKLDYL